MMAFDRVHQWYLGQTRLGITLGFYPMWRGFRLCIYENGGRQSDEVLDINWQIWRFGGALTLWRLGRLAILTRRLPAGPHGDGYCLGWLPRNHDALHAALLAYVRAQGRMLDRWADGDENVRHDLWRDLHSCEEPARAALAKDRNA